MRVSFDTEPVRFTVLARLASPVVRVPLIVVKVVFVTGPVVKAKYPLPLPCM